jgi:hypothetical protein
MQDIITMGTHLLFARTGKVIDGVTAGPEAKPDSDPSTNYTRVASCQGWQPTPSSTVLRRRSPVLGTFQDREEYEVNVGMEYAFDLQEWSPMTFAEGLLRGEEPVDGVFVPNARRTALRGWWIIQGYRENDDPVVYLNVYGSMRVQPFKFSEGNINPYALIVRQLASSLNTGEVLNLGA